MTHDPNRAQQFTGDNEGHAKSLVGHGSVSHLPTDLLLGPQPPVTIHPILREDDSRWSPTDPVVIPRLSPERLADLIADARAVDLEAGEGLSNDIGPIQDPRSGPAA